jgi:sterol desaturase/sphingolipid hydroxylase (fatty acid hydroxylase superfamily)
MNSQTFLETLLGITCAGLSYWLDSIIEWAVHKWPMHQKLPGPLFRFLFKHHTEVHHRKFSRDDYHHHDNHERGTIAFPFWVGPLLVATATSPFAIFSWSIGCWIPFWSSLTVALCYYACFEGLHQLMHMPDYPVVCWVRERVWFRNLDTHHRIHHQMPSTNYGLVTTFADKIFGTYLSYEEFCRRRKSK